MAVLPDVKAGQRILSQHINAIKNSVHTWLDNVDGGGFTLSHVVLDASVNVPWDSVTNKPATFPPSAHTHDASAIVSGVVAAARLATGTPAANSFVRGDGAWAQVAYGNLSGVPAAFPPAAHTHSDAELLSLDWSKLLNKPTTFAPSPHSHSDAELLSLDWAKLLNKPATFPPSTHAHAAADVTSGVFAVDRLATGTPNTEKYLRGDGVWAIPPGGAGGGQTPWLSDVDAAGFSLNNLGLSKFSAGQRLKIDLWGDGQWGIGMEGNASYTLIASGLSHRWYFGASGGLSKMELSSSALNLNGISFRTDGVILRGQGGIAMGVEWTDTWRYTGNCAGMFVNAEADRIRFLVSPAGTTGAAASQVEPLCLRVNGTYFFQPLYVYGGLNMDSGGSEYNLDFYLTTAGANLKRSRISAYAPSGGLSLQTIDDNYTYVMSQLTLARDKAWVDKPLCVTGNAVYAPGMQGLHLGFDGTSGAVAALKEGVSWQPLNLRGSSINIESQGNGVFVGGPITCNSDLTATAGTTRLGWMCQIIPTSQADPGNFANVGSSHYVYFDPGTKKLVLRYHEYGVAYRNYVLKEGDQGAGTLVYSQNAPNVGLDTSAKFFTTGFKAPAGCQSLRVQGTITIPAGGNVYLWLAFTTNQFAAGASAAGLTDSDYWQILWANTSVGTITFDVTLVRGGASACYCTGAWKLGSGAWNGCYEQGFGAGDIDAKHIALAGRTNGVFLTITGITITAINYY